MSTTAPPSPPTALIIPSTALALLTATLLILYITRLSSKLADHSTSIRHLDIVFRTLISSDTQAQLANKVEEMEAEMDKQRRELRVVGATLLVHVREIERLEGRMGSLGKSLGQRDRDGRRVLEEIVRG